MTIAITGSTGALGNLVVAELLKRRPADELVALARDTSKAQHFADQGVAVRSFDYDSPESLPRANRSTFG